MANQYTNLIFAVVVLGISVILIIVQAVLFSRKSSQVERERAAKEKKQRMQIRDF